MRRKKYRKDRYGRIVGEIIIKAEDVLTSNAFDVLNQEQQEKNNEVSKDQKNKNTKDWVNRSFGKRGSEIIQTPNSTDAGSPVAQKQVQQKEESTIKKQLSKK